MIAHLIRVKDECSDIAMPFAFNATDSFRCGDASDNDVSLLLKFDDKREAQWVITAQHDYEDISIGKAIQADSKSTYRQPAVSRELQ